MKKLLTLFFAALLFSPFLKAQVDPISAKSVATFNAYTGTAIDTTIPYYKDLGVRRVIVADANSDGKQEIIATDYSNGGRVHVMQLTAENTLEIVWSSPISLTSSGSTPRFPQVGDMDGDGMKEIIFEQNGEARINVYEWDGSSWGTEPAFIIDNTTFMGAGAAEGLRYNREVLTVYDFDGDGKTEIIPHAAGSSRQGYVIGVDGQFPGFASVIIEGGSPTQHQHASAWATGSYWTGVPADINGDGQVEIIHHNWDAMGMWAVKVNGPDSYEYPDTNNREGIYHRYMSTDAVSYFGLAAPDVDGDGNQEIAATMYTGNFDMALFDFQEYDQAPNLFYSNPDSVAKRFGIIAKKEDLAALAGKTAAEFWPVVKGDLNKDGKDEIYTGGGRGLNVIAVQYNQGPVLDPSSYSANLVYTGEGGDVFATIKIYNGRVDTVITGTDTSFVFNPNIIDTLYEETPFTAYIFADSVDLDGDGYMELVISEQSVYDSTNVVVYNWADTSKSWERDLEASHKIVNEYRKTVRVLESDMVSGLRDANYSLVTPDDYVLENNYPNPFNPSTLIRFSLPVQKNISLKIYDMLGNEVATLINNQILEKGSHEFTWNGTNNAGVKVSSGNYIASLKFGNFQKSIKMTLLK